MHSKSKNRGTAPRALGVVLSVYSVGCDDGRKPLPDWSAGYEMDAGVVVTDGGAFDGGTPAVFQIALSSEISVPYRLKRSDPAGAGKPCTIDPTAQLGPDKPPSADADITCTLDIEEQDLWSLGLPLQVAGPAGMCDHVVFYHYLYPNFPVGAGPTTVSYSIDENNNYTNEVNSFLGKAQCPFDYSATDSRLPNCCTGSYEERVTNLAKGTVSTRTMSWHTGKLGDCYDGAGYYLRGGELDDEGFPRDLIWYVNRQPFQQQVIYEGLKANGSPVTYDVVSKIAPPNLEPVLFTGDNRPLANFSTAALHNGLPMPLRDAIGRDVYTLGCLDHAAEVIASIRLIVREWNEVGEFAKGDMGNPDTSGQEMHDWYKPGVNYPLPDAINDFCDWDDFQPPADEYPRHPRVK